jgi:two-component system, sensor histidine kinase PdtaS
MSTMMSLLAVQSDMAPDPCASMALKDAENRLLSMGMLYDKLYRSENPGEMPAKDYLPALAREIVADFPNGSDVRIEAYADDFMIGAGKLSTLGILVNEALSYAMKHGFAGRGSWTIKLVARKCGGHTIISIEDDGIGIPDGISFENSPGFGLVLIANLARQLEGTIRIEREEGTRIVLEYDARVSRGPRRTMGCSPGKKLPSQKLRIS